MTLPYQSVSDSVKDIRYVLLTISGESSVNVTVTVYETLVLLWT